MNLKLRFASLLSACLFWSTLYAQTDFNLNLIGSVFDFWNQSADVEIIGDYAYASSYTAGLFIIDISDPEHPEQVGRFRCSGNVLGAAAAGDYAYLAAGHLGLIVLDISDLSNPVEVGRCRVYDAAYNVDVTGNYAFVSAYDDGLKIIDVSDPANPDQVATFGHDSEVKDVTIVGNLCYAACGRDGMRILDITDPEEPFELGQFETPGSEHDSNVDIELHGHIAIMPCLTYGAFFVDVSDPTNPFMLTRLTTNNNFRDVAVYNNFACFADNLGGMNVYNITNPADPVSVGNFPTLGRVRRVKVAGDHAFLLDYYTGLHIIDLDDHNFLEETSNFNEGSTWDVKKQGNLVYTACGFDGLHIVDVSDPTAPTDIGSYDVPRSRTFGVDVEGTLAYLADWGDGMKILDISNPAEPELITEFATSNYLGTLEVENQYAYLLLKYDGFQIADISNPESPFIVGSLGLEGEESFGLDIVDTLAYIANGWDDLRIIDISDPTSPQEISSINATGEAFAVCVVEDIAYVAAGHGFNIIDVSDPHAPFEIGRFNDAESFARDIVIQGNFAILSMSEGGLYVIDISDPASLVVTGYYDTDGYATRLWVEGQFTYLADSHTMSIFDHSSAITDPASTLSGTILDSCTNQPIAGAEIVLTNYHEFATETDEDGNFSFDFLFPLTYAFSISANGFVSCEDSVTVTAGPNEYDLGLIPTPEFEAIAEEEYQFTVPYMGAATDSFVIRNAADCSVDLDFRVMIWEDDIEGRPLNMDFLSVDVENGSLAAGESMQIRIIVDTSLDSLYTGFWGGFLVVETNDPDNGYYGAWIIVTIEPESATEATLPSEFAVSPPYPNPFNPSVTIPFSLPISGMVEMTVYNIMGQAVYDLSKLYPAGSHRVLLDTQSDGMNLSSGMYFVQVRYQDKVHISKIMLMK